MKLYLMESLFPAVLNMSLTAAIVILFVLAARLVLKKAPKIFSYALWGVVLFRLLCPVSISSDLSLLGLLDSAASPVTQHTTTVEHIPPDTVILPMPDITAPVPDADLPANDQTTQQYPTANIPTTPNTGATDTAAPSPAEPTLSAADIVCALWLGGIGMMLLYSAVSFLRLRRQLVGAAKLRDNIYLADHIDTPFVMGLLGAKIYLPSSLSEREQRYILLHEQQHIRRLDHLVKALAFLALCIHWFNPLVWLAFVLSAKDMEMSCDEAVMKRMGEDIRAEYSASLLTLATGRRIIAGTPLAFGEDSTKSRIKNVLNWKKPKAWIILTAAVLCVAVVIFCAGNPTRTDEDGTPDNDTEQSDGAQGENTPDTDDTLPVDGDDPDNEPTQLVCTHPQFTIALESTPVWMTTVQWFYDHDWNTTCEACGTIPQDNAAWASFADCLDGLESGAYDVILIPYNSDRLVELEGYTVVPIQRDAIIFVRSNAEERAGFDLTDEQIRRAFTSDETVYWDAAQTDPIIPASGWLEERSCWPQISHLFGIEPTSSQIVFRGASADNAPMAIYDSGRDGSGLWPHHFSFRNNEANLNGEPISVGGVYPTEQTVADGSYPYSFTYYAVYSPDNPHADDIGDFAAYIQQSNCSAYSMIAYKALYNLPWIWEMSFEDERGPVSFLRADGAQESGLAVDGNVLSLFSAMAMRLKQPDDPDSISTLPGGVRMEFHYLEFTGVDRCHVSLFRTDTAPCVLVLCDSGDEVESAVVYEPQLYLYLTALAEKENAQLTDLDGDGVLEAMLWQYGERDFVIYDYYDGGYHRTSTNETLGCVGSDFTGLIANILPMYGNMVQAQSADGTVSVYRCRDGAFSYVCPLSVALGEQKPEPYSAAASHTLSLTGLSAYENGQVDLVLQDFFHLHAATLVGITPPTSRLIAYDLSDLVRRWAGALRADYADPITRCTSEYQLLRSRYDGEQLTLTVQEDVTLYCTPAQSQTQTIANLSLTHVLCLMRNPSGAYYLAGHNNDWQYYAHYYITSGNTAPHTDNGGFAASHLDLLPPISYSRISDGFLYSPDGGAVAVGDGAPVRLAFDYWTIPLNHNGREISVSYGWARYANALAATSDSADYSVAPVPGSDRYLALTLDGGYTYLIDTATGTILDPLAALDSEAAMRLHSVNFSPDGQYAVVSHHSATVCVLLNCATGEITPLPYASDIYSVYGHFLDDTHILLTSAFEVGAPHNTQYSLSRYDITTGELTELPGQYTAKDSTASNFLSLCCESAAVAYTFENGYLVLVDLMSEKRTATSFPASEIDSIFCCPDNLAGVICYGVLYLVDDNGAALSVCRAERNFQNMAP